MTRFLAIAIATSLFSTTLAADEEAQKLLASAIKHCEANDLDKAEPELNQALARFEAELRANADDPVANFGAGECLFWLGQYEPALGHYDKAVAGDAKNATYWFRRAMLRLNRGEGQPAEVDLDKAVELAPAETRYRYERATLHELTDRLDLAATGFAKVVELQPKNVPAHCALGRVLAKKGDLDGAAKRFDLAAKADPADPAPHRLAGQAMAGAGKIDRGMARWTLGIEKFPEDFELRELMVQACFALGSLEKATPHRAKLAELFKAGKAPRPCFVFERYSHGAYSIEACEMFDTTAPAHTHTQFRVYERGTLVKAVNLETSPELRSAGKEYCLGMLEQDAYLNLEASWTKLPSYTDLKAAVGKALDGQLKVLNRQPR